MMPQLLHRRARRQVACTRNAGALVTFAFLALFGGIDAVHAQQPTPTDWRAHLTCPSEHQVRDGLLYCTVEYRSQTIHIVVADLTVPSIRFEYLLPQDYSRGEPRECRDPNLPSNGSIEPGGCLDLDGVHHPTITIDAAVKLVETYQQVDVIRHDLPLAAVINADYGAPPEFRDHGAEGLMVVRSQRLDGASQCDDDFNAALRPWLALGETVDKTTGLIPVTIDRLPADSTSPPVWTYTAFGGGPFLLREGQLNVEADNCASAPPRVLQTLDPVTNCRSGLKPVRPTPLAESYGHSCYSTAHTAAGLSGDGRWLFLVINEGELMPESLAEFMRDTLGVQDALKFDGGGSSALWFNGVSEININPVSDVRPLSNWMAVFAAEGDGIDLPLDAAPSVSLQHSIVSAGETTSFQIVMHNTGEFTWAPEDGVELREVSSLFRPIRAGEEGLPLQDRVAPLQPAQWEWQSEPKNGGVALHRFRMTRRGEAFGDEAAVLVVTIPKELEEQRAEIEKRINEMIQEWQTTGQQKLEELFDQIADYLVDLTKTGLEKLFRELCGSLGLAVILPVGFTLWRRRRS